MATGVIQAEQMGTALASEGERLSLGDDRAFPAATGASAPRLSPVSSLPPQLLLFGINKDECT